MKVKEKADLCANYAVMLTPRHEGMQVRYLLTQRHSEHTVGAALGGRPRLRSCSPL